MTSFFSVVVVVGVDLTAGLSASVEAAKLFGRLADKKLLLDVPFAGTPELRNCCHVMLVSSSVVSSASQGGCDNCDFSRVFDEMNSGRPKWICLYTEREFIDGRRHEPTWAGVFGPGGDEALSSSEFYERVCLLPYRATLGPKCSVSPDEAPSAAVVERLYAQLLPEGASALTARDVAVGLRRLTGQDHGAPWKIFAELLEGP